MGSHSLMEFLNIKESSLYKIFPITQWKQKIK
jgi:hypothetical protein